MVIPVLVAPFLYGEKLGWVRIAAILLGLTSIGLMVMKDKKKEGSRVDLTGLTLLVFFGTGLCTAIIKYSRHYLVSDSAELSFVSSVFALSAFLGWIQVSILGIPKRKLFLKSIGAGILLGIPNLGSLVFLVKALATPGLDSSIVFPVNNISIVLLSTLIGWLVFKEYVPRAGMVGIVAAVISVILLSAFPN
jgi:drug/metabolite transporter (DMT)-like permease